MTPRLRDCGNPACSICRFNRDGYRDSGHVDPDESLATALLGTAALVLLAVFFFVLLPAVAS